jgi:hypothetical protein
LALIISNDEHVMRLDLCSLITLERYWSFKFGLPSRNYTLSCCLLTNNEWMIIDQNDSELLHISKDGSFLKKYYCNSPLYAAVQFTDDSIAIVSEEGISLHRLVWTFLWIIVSLFILLSNFLVTIGFIYI